MKGQFAELYQGVVDANGGKPITAQELSEMADKFAEIMMLYSCAINEVRTKLENLNSEFAVKATRNPISAIKSRVKAPASLFEKLKRKGLRYSEETLLNDIQDIAGIRVVCAFVDDIYMIANMLISQDDITLIKKKDYIKNPKANGYRSLHLVVEVPVFLSDTTKIMQVEVEIRTIAMDFWASLEHSIRYKKIENASEYVMSELKDCADTIYETDIRMQKIRGQLWDK